MIIGDAAYIKKMNRASILKGILKEGMISRAELSKVTALTRATISSQVADLLEEDLVVETQLEHNVVGRKPIMLSLNAEAGYALGIDLAYDEIKFILSDLLGRPIASASIKTPSTDYKEILSLLINYIAMYNEQFQGSRYGIVGIVIAVHGLVASDEVIHYAPRFHWNHIDLKSDLEKTVSNKIFIENNANLSALAERVFIHHETDNLLCATFYKGIGLGMIMNDKFFRGHDGFAGEIGHMIVVPEGHPCNCGNKGCFEKYASESSVFEYLSQKRGMKDVSYQQIEQWLAEGDSEVEELLQKTIYYLSIGLNNMINMYNPDVVVLDSELLRMYPDALNKIKQNLNSKISHYRKLAISSLGRNSCVMGACALAITYFLDVKSLILPNHRTLV
ncbi:ROK family protein [Paenibacillus sp. FSL H8-0548]|uniref:ROK family transcriptional regulator n=1 Tax=Paenibacillus sp. FSL H8-0548 TaxID=1920422 RepID=UPI00096DFFB9|nr:ROK family transcriptional regulator [Paenibacillus sp. FSL H8-0548]OMF22686.1 ROK family protein [Paenibacillus sp. FSL H8-0548]